MKKFILVSLWCLILPQVYSQEPVENFLKQIEQNNPDLKKQKLNFENTLANLKNNNIPNGVSLSHDRLRNSLDQSIYLETVISQEFDFPALYLIRHQISKETVLLNRQLYRSERNEIWAKAWQTLLEYQFQLKMLSNAKLNYELIDSVNVLEKKAFEKKQTDILRYTLSNLELTQLKVDYNELQNKLFDLKKSLQVMNGGVEPENIPVDWGAVLLPASIDSLANLVLIYNPQLQAQATKVNVATLNSKVNKWNNLPTFEIGFRYDDGITEDFKGVHTGLNIPLWKNSYQVKASNQIVEAEEISMEGYRTKLASEIEVLKASYKNTYENYLLLSSALNSVDFMSLLKKSYQTGNMQVVEYFTQMHDFINHQQNLLKLEYELKSIEIELRKHLI